MCLLNVTAIYESLQGTITNPAFFTAVAALLTAVAGAVYNYRNMKSAKEQWITEAVSRMESHYLDYVVQERMRTYAPVLRTLGKVRDIPDPHEDHWKALQENPEILLPVADELLSHLYGEPGLVMEMETRNALLNAYYACLTFQDGDMDVQQVVDSFFKARRKLRADLQIQDPGERTRHEEIIRSFERPHPR